jgi:ribosomal protein S28E/S33
MISLRILVAASAIGLAWASPSEASDKLGAGVSLSGTTISVALPSGYSNATLSVAGPDGRVLTRSVKGGVSAIDIGGANAMGDGTYNYQVTAASPEKRSVKVTEDNGREIQLNMRGEITVPVGEQASGTFIVKGGRIVDMTGIEEAAK